MAKLLDIPKPHLDARLFGARCIPALTDDALAQATGVRIAFTGRAGGVSAPPYDGLNLAGHVGDDPAAVRENRAILLEALGVPGAHLATLSQVHGTEGVRYDGSNASQLAAQDERARAGADYAVVDVADVAALLCFADCASLIIVSPSGRFAVAHAGWRGAVAHIAAKAADRLARADAEQGGSAEPSRFNAYIGPHIHAECFECGPEVVERFRREFGQAAIADERHVDLREALRADLRKAGLADDRIVDSGICTMCHPQRYYSYRASGGVCGRHGAVAVRIAAGEGRSHIIDEAGRDRPAEGQ